MDDMVDHQCRDLSLKERKRLLDLMIYVAYSDGHYGREQERLHIAREQLGLGKKYTHKRLGRAAKGKLKVVVPESGAGQRLSLELMIKMMKADRDVGQNEEGVFYEVAESYGMTEDEAREMLEKHFPGYQLTQRGEPSVISKWLTSNGQRGDNDSALSVKGSSGKFGFLGLASLIIANLIPLAGVLFLDWSVSYIMILYWIENVIVGVVSIGRISDLKRMPDYAKRKMTLIAAIHYGAFLLAHGWLLLQFVVAIELGVEETFRWGAALSIVVQMVMDAKYLLVFAIVLMLFEYWMVFQRQVDVWQVQFNIGYHPGTFDAEDFRIKLGVSHDNILHDKHRSGESPDGD